MNEEEEVWTAYNRERRRQHEMRTEWQRKRDALNAVPTYTPTSSTVPKALIAVCITIVASVLGLVVWLIARR